MIRAFVIVQDMIYDRAARSKIALFTLMFSMNLGNFDVLLF